MPTLGALARGRGVGQQCRLLKPAQLGCVPLNTPDDPLVVLKSEDAARRERSPFASEGITLEHITLPRNRSSRKPCWLRDALAISWDTLRIKSHYSCTRYRALGGTQRHVHAVRKRPADYAVG